MDLIDSIQAMLIEHHIARSGVPLPPMRTVAGDYVLAANGVFKRVMRPGIALTIQVEHFRRPIPGLRSIDAGITWQHWPHKLPGDLLLAFLDQARQATIQLPPINDVARVASVEYHSVFLYRNNQVELHNTTMHATTGQVTYTLPPGDLLRIHSHHTMPAFFSAQDDADDEDCSVSAVIGDIFSERPSLCVRVNAYGHRQLVPATDVFSYLGVFEERTHDKHCF